MADEATDPIAEHAANLKNQRMQKARSEAEGIRRELERTIWTDWMKFLNVDIVEDTIRERCYVTGEYQGLQFSVTRTNQTGNNLQLEPESSNCWCHYTFSNRDSFAERLVQLKREHENENEDDEDEHDDEDDE